MRRFVEFDFTSKSVREIDASAVQASMEAGRFVWLDLCCESPGESRAALIELLPQVRPVVEAAVTDDHDTAYTPFPDALHISVVACRLEGDGLRASRVDALMGDRFFVTVCREPVGFLDSMRREYEDDFLRFARTPSFLIYEFFDHLMRSYEQVQQRFEHEVEGLHRRLLSRVDDEALADVSRVGSDLLHLRKHVVPSRGVLNELATRRSAFVSEVTQPFLHAMVGELDRVLADITADRDILSDSLNLAVSIIGYRTNQVINKLTILSFVFLPLTFLVGLYGMNFKHQPEYEWKHGYVYFWLLAFLVASLAFLFIQRARGIRKRSRRRR